MSRRLLRTLSIAFLAVFCTFTVMGCGHSVSGKYKDDTGSITIDFESGKANVTTLGITQQVDYTVSGNQVTLTGYNGANLVLTVQNDGSITGFPGIDKLTKA